MCWRWVFITLRRFFWHLALHMNWGLVLRAYNDNSWQGKYRKEGDFLQILTAEGGSTRREEARLVGGVHLPGKRTSNTSLPLVSGEALMLCCSWRKRHYRSAWGLWLQRVIWRSEMNRRCEEHWNIFTVYVTAGSCQEKQGISFSL